VTAADARLGALDFLADHDAAGTDHLFGPLLEHLVGVERLLREWGARDDLALAGLCHAAYGTAGFDEAMIDVADRAVLSEAVGPAVENLVYVYASCDRDAVYPRLPGTAPVDFADRFRGTSRLLGEAELRDFMDLTLANEVELAAASPGGPAEWTWLADFCAECGHRASPAAASGAAAILTPTS
jgi:hypothetical protein